MATYQTYQQVGLKEDVSDIITNISPTKTPFQSSIGSEKVHNTLFQWQEDSLRAAAANAKVEGADPSDITATPTVMRTNYTQILEETVKTSGTADVVSKYGRAKESAYQMAKTAAQLKRDLERAMVGAATDKAVGAAAVARTFASYHYQINTSGTSNVIYTGAGPAALSEAKLLEALQVSFNAGADPTRIMVTPGNSLIVADFAKASGRYRTIDNGAGDKATSAIINVVDLYVSPFGEQRVVVNRFLKTLNTLVYEPAQWKRATLRDWTRETLAKTGDSLKQMLIGEFSLKHANFSASALIVEGTTGF
jgi:hypothetical protein